MYWHWPIAGIRLPVIMSVTFAAVTPMLAIGVNPDIGLMGNGRNNRCVDYYHAYCAVDR